MSAESAWDRMAHPIRHARVSTLAQKSSQAAVKVGPSAKENKTNFLIDNSALDLATLTGAPFAPVKLKHGSSIFRTEIAVNN